jgi:hypothetical protein
LKSSNFDGHARRTNAGQHRSVEISGINNRSRWAFLALENNGFSCHPDCFAVGSGANDHSIAWLSGINRGLNGGMVARHTNSPCGQSLSECHRDQNGKESHAYCAFNHGRGKKSTRLRF